MAKKVKKVAVSDAAISEALTNNKPITAEFLGLAVKTRKQAVRRVEGMTLALSLRIQRFAALAMDGETVYRFSDGAFTADKDRAEEARKVIGRTIGSPKISGVTVRCEVVAPGTKLKNGETLDCRKQDGTPLYMIIGRPFTKPGAVPNAAAC